MIGDKSPLIRRAVASEAAALTGLVMRSKAHWGYDDVFMEACCDELSVRGEDIDAYEVWVAESDRLLGMYKLVPGEKAYLHLLFVETGTIGTGLGKRLWSHLEKRAVKTGGKTVYLEADPFAKPFYERMGMVQVGEAPSGSIPGRMLPLMEKQLTRP